MTLLVDINQSVPRWQPFLAEAGIEALHWIKVGCSDAPDATIMACASEHGYVVLTHDLDFSAILAATHGERPGVVQLRSEDVSPDTVGSVVVGAIRRRRMNWNRERCTPCPWTACASACSRCGQADPSQTPARRP